MKQRRRIITTQAIGLFIVTIALTFSPCSAAIQQPSAIVDSVSSRHAELRDFALKIEGDAIEGKALFEDQQKLGCNKCHSVDGQSRSVGPNLFAVGHKLDRAGLVTSILEPSKTIAVGYGTTTLLNLNGQVFEGVLQRVTNKHVELLDKENKIVRIPVEEIEQQRDSTISIMPSGLEAKLSDTEFSNLIAYMESLKPKQSYSSNGVTDSIPRASSEVDLVDFFEGMRFDHPVWFGQIPMSERASSDKANFAVLEQIGRAYVIRRENGKWIKDLWLDLRSSVRMGGATGLLGIAFHPKFSQNQRCVLKYQTLKGDRIQTVVAECVFPPSGTVVSITDLQDILRIDAVTQDHNGGCVEFGPDGYLYIGMGDSGPQGDPQGHGQDLKTWLGKILRIDIDHRTVDNPFTIPSDNPFVGRPSVKPEIWAWGFREPWRFSFDSDTGDFWVGDVGQNRIEEVAVVRAGENHGWNVFEGHIEHSNDFRNPEAQYVKPVFSYPRSLGVSITGGYVYRGHTFKNLQSWYLCGDFESRRIWALRQSERELAEIVEVGRSPSRIVSFGQDSDRNLYVVGFDNGVIYRMGFQNVDLTARNVRLLAETSQQAPVPWRYTTTEPSADWTQAEFDDQSWKVGPGGFGTSGTPGAVVRTDWSSRNIWLRRTFALDDLPHDASKVALVMHHDEDVEVYLNGIQATRQNGWTSGYIEFTLSADSVRGLRQGQNVIAIHCRQTGGGQYIDAGIITYESPNSPSRP